jgi:hypothetical protein
LYQGFSSLHIIVEQAIGDLKDWAVVNETIRLPAANMEVNVLHQ